MDQMEVFFNLVFTAEILLRLSIAETYTQVFFDFFFIFDVLSVMPYWVGLGFKYKLVMGSRGMGFRKRTGKSALGKVNEMFKALRMLRLLKLTRRYDGSIVIVHALKDSSSALAAPFFFLFVAVVMCGTFLFHIEEDRPYPDAMDKDQHFQTVVHAIWFMVVTFLTVGFGDVYPMTPFGKVMTSMAMFIGIFDMARAGAGVE